MHISNEKNMFIRSLVSKYGKHTVYTDGGTWYPQACNFLNLKHRLMQYFKDRTECFDDYYPCINQNRNCDLLHVYNWIKLFIYLYNTTIRDKHYLSKKEVK